MTILSNWLASLKQMTKPLPPVFHVNDGMLFDTSVLNRIDKNRLKNFAADEQFTSNEKVIVYRGMSSNVTGAVFALLSLENKQDVADMCQQVVQSNILYRVK